MTRDEAIKILFETPWNPRFASTMDSIEAQKFVAAASALGMLKLDEPTSARERFREELIILGYSQHSCGLRDALKAFDASQK